jgi:hypothetical protein
MKRAALFTLAALWMPFSPALSQPGSEEAIRQLSERVSDIIERLETESSGDAFAAVRQVSNGVRMDGDNPLGQFFAVPGTDTVNFQECGSSRSEVIAASLVEPTKETCKSRPGTATPSIPHFASTRWTFDPNKNGYTVTTVPGGGETPGTVAFVDCASVPTALIVAAEKAVKGTEGVAGSREALSTLDVPEGQGTETGATDRPTLAQCRDASEFWTLQSAGVPTVSDSRLFGVTSRPPPFM